MDEHVTIKLAERCGGTTTWSHDLRKSDVIVVLCSHDTTVAERGAQLWLDGWAPLLVFAGGLGAITRHLWSDPEADRFARIAMGMGVPKDRILIENRSTNTGENVAFTRDLLLSRGFDPAVLHPGSETVHGAPDVRHIQPGMARQVGARDLASSFDGRLPHTVFPRIAIGRRRHQHHGRGPAANPRVPRARISDPAGDPGGRVGRLQRTRKRRLRSTSVAG